jgi:hypothetical protein
MGHRRKVRTKEVGVGGEAVNKCKRLTIKRVGVKTGVNGLDFQVWIWGCGKVF